MKLQHKFLPFVMAFVMLLTLPACSKITSQATYFGGIINAYYSRHDTSQRGARYDFTSDYDQLKIVFHKTGVYHVSFSGTPDKQNGALAKYMPNDFDVAVTKADRQYLIRQYLMPPYLRMTITFKGDNASETHDFQ